METFSKFDIYTFVGCGSRILFEIREAFVAFG
jgi:hypothetical protein